MSKPSITAERAREVLNYDPLTGLFTWKAPKRPQYKIGSIAGTKMHTGYTRITIDQKHYQAHRLAFLIMEGSFPNEHVDHIDGTKDNNRWKNLRKCSVSQNLRNRAACNKSGLPKGVRKHHKKYVSSITYRKKQYHLGSFQTPEEAHQAYCAKAGVLHGDFFHA